MSFRKGETYSGIEKFKLLFEKKRDHYDALCTLIIFLYRAGKIDESNQFFEQIEKEIPKSLTEPGYNYARGLFYQ